MLLEFCSMVSRKASVGYKANKEEDRSGRQATPSSLTPAGKGRWTPSFTEGPWSDSSGVEAKVGICLLLCSSDKVSKREIDDWAVLLALSWDLRGFLRLQQEPCSSPRFSHLGR